MTLRYYYVRENNVLEILDPPSTAKALIGDNESLILDVDWQTMCEEAGGEKALLDALEIKEVIIDGISYPRE